MDVRIMFIIVLSNGENNPDKLPCTASLQPQLIDLRFLVLVPELQVARRRCDARVARKLLDGVDRHARAQEHRDERVPQRMRGELDARRLPYEEDEALELLQ